MTSSASTHPCDVVIVGGSAAGLSAALALGRSRRSVVVIDAGQPRNATSAHIHGVLGQDGLSPTEFLDLGRRDLQPYDVTFVDGTVTGAARRDDGTLEVSLDDGRTYAARALLAATGVRDELPDIPGLRERWGIDVLHCPYCHGWEVRDQQIAVLGTMPMSAHTGFLFRQLSADVTLVLHNDTRPGDEEMAKLAARGVAIVEGPVTGLVVEDNRLQGLRLFAGEVLATQALVVAPRADASSVVLDAFGLQPVPHPMGAQLGTTYAVEMAGRTSVPGLWAVGNVVDLAATVAKSVADGYLTGAMINTDLIFQDTVVASAEVDGPARTGQTTGAHPSAQSTPTSPLVDPDWLAAHLGDDDLLVVDASADMSPSTPGGYVGRRDQYTAGHVPGAVFADVVDALSEPGAALPLTRPGNDRLAAAFGALGIGAETMVVLYDSSTGSWAARVWWLLRSLGHDRAVVLDGGLRAWTVQGRALEGGDVTPTSADFVARERPEVWADQDRVRAVVRGEEHDHLLNAISSRPAGVPAEFATAFTHQIPGSTAVPYPDLIDDETGALLPADELERALQDVPEPGRTVVYCGSAIGAATAALVLVSLGRAGVAIYDGSLAEWLADPHAPLEVK